MKVLANRTALVTGASRGIGLHICRRFNKGTNATLYSAVFHQQNYAKPHTSLLIAGLRFFQYRRIWKTAPRSKLSYRNPLRSLVLIDVLVNNAGIETFYPYDEISLDDISGRFA